MTYILIWCPEMGIFVMGYPDTTRKTFPEEDLRKSFGTDKTLNAWADFAQAHPNRECAYDALPK